MTSVDLPVLCDGPRALGVSEGAAVVVHSSLSAFVEFARERPAQLLWT